MSTTKKNKKAIKKKYSEVADKMRILQIPNNAIIEGVIQKMLGKEEFKDTTTNGDLIYSGSIFDDILNEETFELSDKVLTQLTELSILSKKYQYIMVIDNPQ